MSIRERLLRDKASVVGVAISSTEPTIIGGCEQYRHTTLYRLDLEEITDSIKTTYHSLIASIQCRALHIVFDSQLSVSVETGLPVLTIELIDELYKSNENQVKVSTDQSTAVYAGWAHCQQERETSLEAFLQ